MRGLDQDHDAAVAGLTVGYSNCPIEGVNAKTKLIKRQMYGRASWVTPGPSAAARASRSTTPAGRAVRQVGSTKGIARNSSPTCRGAVAGQSP
ncbi:hypothetical protein ACIA5H_18150 [Nocardia sp. NPDC051900]|uniref:hypothetical protein n=1 Tax=Nocardia sp. NPDC051900 TaxID=3364326 RepID=UPI0037935E43